MFSWSIPKSHVVHLQRHREAGETSALLLAADQQRNLGEMIDATETAERALALARRTGNARHEEEAPLPLDWAPMGRQN